MTKTGDLKVTAAGEREIVMTRSFDAPRHLVFKAWTTPELLQKWLGAMPGWSMPVCEVDLRVGGTYRYLWKNEADGSEMGMRGVFREIVVPERIISTEKFDEAWYPGEGLGTITFDEQDGRTLLTQTMVYESREARDAVLQSGMEQGVEVSYDRLEEVLASLGSERS